MIIWRAARIMRRNATPPAASVPYLKIPSTRAWGSVGMQPMAVIIPVPSIVTVSEPSWHRRPPPDVLAASLRLQVHESISEILVVVGVLLGSLQVRLSISKGRGSRSAKQVSVPRRVVPLGQAPMHAS